MEAGARSTRLRSLTVSPVVFEWFAYAALAALRPGERLRQMACRFCGQQQRAHPGDQQPAARDIEREAAEITLAEFEIQPADFAP